MKKKISNTKKALHQCKTAFRQGQITKEQYDATLILLFDNMVILENENSNVEFVIEFLNSKAVENPILHNINFSFCLN